MNEKEYFFYEWLIIGKQMSQEEFEKLSETEFKNLKSEYAEFCKTLNRW